MLVNIDKLDYLVNDNEFLQLHIQKYCNLNILNDVGDFERLISCMIELCNALNIPNFIHINPTHGGFIDLNCANKIPNIYIYFNDISTSHYSNINTNILNHNINNINIINDITTHISNIPTLIYIENINDINISLYNYKNAIVITKNNTNELTMRYDFVYKLKNTNYNICFNIVYYSKFYNNFKYYIEDNNILNYDNLINLCIMVKNGGEQFENMLLSNLPYIDRWTILDTGSTDNTINIINKVLVEKKGCLYQRPFINFKDSRNKLLKLAGKTCKYTLMLDDTYIINGDLRKFLTQTRGDQYSDSFSLYIKSNDSEYGSNRIIKTSRQLKYLFRIHEVVQNNNNNNVMIPISDAFILDGRFEYMEDRTNNRKQLDLKFLYEELKEDPNNSRTHYYLAQTYNCLGDFENSYKWYLERINHPSEGFIQEKVDAAFEAARTANFKLNLDWNICEKLYITAYELDKSRPESLYFMGIHHYLNNDIKKAYPYFKQAFVVGYPQHCQYSLKPTLTFHFNPKFLAKICYAIEDYKLGLQASLFFLQNNKPLDDCYNEMVSWYKIYEKLNIYKSNNIKLVIKPDKPIFCFVADGGFSQWSGKNILSTGVGGSETYIIEMAKYIQKMGTYNVYVFCNCSESDLFEDVQYYNLSKYYEFINTNYVNTCIISRFSEYIPVTYKSHVENVYLVCHDLTPSGIVIPLDRKLKKIFCLTEWHVNYMNSIFPQLTEYNVPFYYGIDFNKFSNINNIKKIPYKFIYSSFPNRGLLQLLQMWREIYNMQPNASLHIYADIDGKWVNDVEPEQIKNIKLLLDEYKNLTNGLNIKYYGWVDKKTLADSWLSSDIWFYPCTFMETFCLTALEAALTKTLVITNDLAALQNTAGDRGVIIKGDANTSEWQQNALAEIKKYIWANDFLNSKNELINKNYKWAETLSWENQAHKLIDTYITPLNQS